MCTLKAANAFNVSRITLQTLSIKFYLSKLLVSSFGLWRKLYLDLEPKLEEKLVSYLLTMEHKFLGCTFRDLKETVYQLVVRINQPFPFKNGEGDGSIGWSISESLPDRWVLPKRNMDAFFIILEEASNKHSFPASRVYNVCVTGLSIVQSKVPYVLGRKGKRQIAGLTSAERSATFNIVGCMSASGHFVPLLWFFSRAIMAKL